MTPARAATTERRRFPQRAFGSRVGDYELVAKVASGGMASVYLAFPRGAKRLEDRVAIKILHHHWAEDPELVRAFFEEFRIAQLVNHEHVVPVIASGLSDGRPYLVMQYVEGDTLADRWTASADGGAILPPSIGLRVVIDMLLGLHAAHETRDAKGQPLGLVHRDVSPQNTLIGVDGVARLIDFGLARVHRDDPSVTFGTKGKLAYIAPEEVTGEAPIDRRADVFASGIVLWEVLTGRRLFRAVNDAATLDRVVSSVIEHPERFVTGLHPGVGDICLRALARAPSQRIGTALHLAEMLEAAGSTTPIASHVEVARYMWESIGQRVTQERLIAEHWLRDAGGRAAPEVRHGTITASRQRQSSIGGWIRSRPTAVGLMLLVLVALVIAACAATTLLRWADQIEVHLRRAELGDLVGPARLRVRIIETTAQVIGR
ncbi:MAG TPA: serine/threonine-protein kinase [Polyangiaceae bacterium]